ncbi:hypothetical protein BC936DRAFT_144052 [Jimgerdemannia flammicorona]|uniref:Uncharacterized protein n=2 Tax=Jimgerdemannia flammicorona TaxID=994334 RepID=A0A433PI91_9FUNG|nr:hypothetical protein BC936DRAFT_144052 [Jimgerdemannia flammicorona]RUS17264.1 hypothetical protein BC938DRAFT_476305 [Jimgerdemannia flammicorona]
MAFYTYLTSVTLFSIIVVALYMLFTGSGEEFNVGRVIEETSPYAWALIGMSMCIGLSVVGAAW